MRRSHQANHKARQSASGSGKDDGIVVRPFRMEDYDPVFALWQRCEGVGLGASDTRAAIAAYLRRNPGLSFVAQMKSRLVGAVLCGHDGRRGYLHHLAVSKRHRRAGLGRRLVDICLERLRRIDIQKCNIFVFADNVEGMTFWTRTGWTPRPDLSLLQVDLSCACSRKRSC
jgi:ribosomal protein S18 acetylase RimI-like enzyme